MNRFLCGIFAAVLLFVNVKVCVLARTAPEFELPEKRYFDAGKTADDIELIVNSKSVLEINSQDNKVIIDGLPIKQKSDEAKAEAGEYVKKLNEHGMFLNREIVNEVTVSVRGLNLSDYAEIYVDEENLNEMKGINKLNIAINDENERISLFGNDIDNIIQQKHCLKMQIKKLTKTYSIMFLEQDNTVIDKYPVNIEIGLSSYGSNQTVYMYRNNSQENWGGQYNAAENLIEFQTKYSGEYSVTEPQIDIADIGNLAEYEKQAIYFMTVRDYFKLNEGKFEPNNKLSRYDFTESLVRMFFALDNEAVCTFPDVSKKYYQYIAASQQSSIVEGFDDGTFRGNDNVTLEQVLALASRTISEKNGYLYPEQIDKYLNFPNDNLINDWAKKEVALAIREGIYDREMQLHFADAISRKDAAVILYRLFMIMNNTPKVSVLESQSTNENIVHNTIWTTSTLIITASVVVVIDISALLMAIHLVKRKRNAAEASINKGDAGDK